MRSWLLIVLLACAGCADDAKPSCQQTYSHYYGLGPSCGVFEPVPTGFVIVPLDAVVETCQDAVRNYAASPDCTFKFADYLRCIADLDRCDIRPCVDEELALSTCGRR